jgi:hypothetical protein
MRTRTAGDEVGLLSADICCGIGVEFVEGPIDRAAGNVVFDYRRSSLIEGICGGRQKGRSWCMCLMR